MDHLTIPIPIPDGLPADQKRDLAGYLTDQVKRITGDGPSIDDDPAVRAEIVRRIKQGMADMEAGRFCSADEARRRIADHLDETRPR
jgi:predicted transcriptional regulator